MTHKNYKSDFDAILHLYRCRKDDNGEEVREEVDFPPYDWVARFYTSSKANAYSSKANAYIVSCIGGKCTNCFNDGGKIHAVFDSHRMGPGILNVEFVAQLPNSIYPDGLQQEVRPQPLDIELVSGMGDCGCRIDMSVVLPYAVVDAYDVAVAAGFEGTAEEYYAGLSLLPALSAATSDFAAGKAEVAAALRLQGIEASEADSLHDMARDIAAMRLAADSEPGVISHGGCGVPDLLNLLHNNRRLDDYPYSWAVRTADNHVMLSGADAYLCSDGYFTTEPGEHTFANADEVPESWVIFYHSSPNYTVTASAGILSEICVYNGTPDYNVVDTPSAYLVGPLHSHSTDRRPDDGYSTVAVNGAGISDVALAEVSRALNPVFFLVPRSSGVILSGCVEISSAGTVFGNTMRSLRLPALRTFAGALFSDGNRITELVFPSLETITGGRFAYYSTSLTKLSLPSLVSAAGENIARNCIALTEVNLPKLKTTSATIVSGCAALTELNLPALETMNNGTLANSCAALTELNLPQCVEISVGINNPLTVGIAEDAVRQIDAPLLKTFVSADNRSRILEGGGHNTLIVNVPQCTKFAYPLFYNSRGSTAHLHFGAAIESITAREGFSQVNTCYLRLYIAEGARTSLSVLDGLKCDADNLKQFIADLGDNNNYNTKSLQIGVANLALLSENDIALAVAKNYTLS